MKQPFSIVLALLAAAALAAPADADTVDVDVSGALFSIGNMQSIDNSNASLQQSMQNMVQQHNMIMQSMMNAAASAGSRPAYSAGQIRVMSQRFEDMDRFTPTSSDAPREVARELESDPSKRAEVAGRLRSALDQIYGALAKRGTKVNHMTQAVALYVALAYKVSGGPAFAGPQDAKVLQARLQMFLTAFQLLKGHAFSNAEKQDKADVFLLNALIVASRKDPAGARAGLKSQFGTLPFNGDQFAPVPTFAYRLGHLSYAVITRYWTPANVPNG